MTPKQRYHYDLANNAFQIDSAQSDAIDMLDELHLRLTEYQAPQVETRSFFSKLLRKKPAAPSAPKGIYLWGGVGRGKTYLMDTFFESVPSARKIRMHFHRFMYRVHDELKQLKDVADPLDIVAQRFKEETDIICFDEFFVSDITDAMILGTLFQSLFAQGIILVATSNIPPHLLYRNGLQRARFLPAIALIEKHCQIINVDSGVDYRLRTLEQADIYHFPNDEKSMDNLNRYYDQLIHQQENEFEGYIEVNHRRMPIIKSSHGVLLITFEQLCETMRSAGDYIEISRLYHTVLLADVKQMNEAMDDAARRFIALVDEFYERRVKLILSAEVALEKLYVGRQLEFEFQRCQSRLTEMQSREYLARDHLS
ncbi:AFG1-like ATPase [Vibrio aerogenes CECT 7868]|uniref:Cell division protein ZapE n=1 Tax=Vibrio aerogenes CECT 7868 TaxID=1216006 RepID=A0A1M5YCY8_9VIBR|nr:cell division protein ZapE [Vibrio aerogenes]SHI09930.1 AFG1-like ATPase [Vibrio aerogenes CECT 7868]